MRLLRSEEIKQAALDTGFSFCGIARVHELSEQKENLDRWVFSGYDSGLGYMKRDTDKRCDPSLLVEGAKSIVVCGVNYKNRAWDQNKIKTKNKIASYAMAPDYHDSIKAMLCEVLEKIKASGTEVTGRCFCDTAPLLEKSWAIEAGLGWRGKNSLLITPGFGSFVLLGEIVVDAGFDNYDEVLRGKGCGNCTLCIDSCPSGAVCEPYIIDTAKCISRLTVEKIAAGESGGREDMLNGWIFGCDQCQSCCPHNQKTPLCSDPRFTPSVEPETLTDKFWGNLSKDDFKKFFGKTPLSRTGYETIKSRIEKDCQKTQK